MAQLFWPWHHSGMFRVYMTIIRCNRFECFSKYFWCHCFAWFKVTSLAIHNVYKEIWIIRQYNYMITQSFKSMIRKQVSRAGTSNYILQILWGVITCPCLDTCFWPNIYKITHLQMTALQRHRPWIPRKPSKYFANFLKIKWRFKCYITAKWAICRNIQTIYVQIGNP